MTATNASTPVLMPMKIIQDALLAVGGHEK